MIPFNRAGALGRERELMAEALARGSILGDGPFGKRCEALLEECTGAHRALLTTSCTHALEMAALLLDIRPGDEVVVPSFTFVSAANAFVLRGATPVFAEIRGDTLNLDERLLPPLITRRTRAVFLVIVASSSRLCSYWPARNSFLAWRSVARSASLVALAVA